MTHRQRVHARCLVGRDSLPSLALTNYLWVPEELFTEKHRKALTVVHKTMADETVTVYGFVRDKATSSYGVARQYGLKSFSKYRIEDYTSEGKAASFPKQVSLRPEQKPIVDEMCREARVNHDYKMSAPTGFGKTVMALAMAARLGRQTLVIVDQENLLEQWVERAEEHLGLTKKDIGIIRGDKCDIEGKPLVIGMMQSLVRRQYDNRVYYGTFGLVIWDEAHVAGAELFSESLGMFDARNRIGISATIDRKDSLGKLLDLHLGSVRVKLTAEHSPSLLYVINYGGRTSWVANNSRLAGRYINELAEDGERNLVIANAALWLYQSGRNVLLIGDRVEQLVALRILCRQVGIPEDDMEIVSKQTVTTVYEKDPKPPRRPEFWERGTEYTPVRLVFKQKTIPTKKRKDKKYTKRVILSTYGIMAKGVDVPELSAGIDVTPRADSVQVHGRILRDREKLIPIWVTIVDTYSFRALHQFMGRLNGYTKDNAEVYLWDYHKGRKKLDTSELRPWIKDRVRELQSIQIGMNLDASSTLPTLTIPTEQNALLGTPISPRTPKNPQSKES